MPRLLLKNHVPQRPSYVCPIGLKNVMRKNLPHPQSYTVGSQKRGKPYYQRQVLKIRDDCFFFESYTMFFFSVALVIALKHVFLQPSFLANLYEFKGACLILPYNTKSGRGVLYTHTPLPCLLHLSQSESLSLRHFLMTKITEASL